MAKIIDSNTIVANAFISTKQKSLSLEDIYEYINIFDKKLEQNIEYHSNDFNLYDFIYIYDFAFTYSDNTITVTFEKNISKILERYFRLGLPKEIIKSFDESGYELLSNNQEKNKRLTLNKQKEYEKNS